jgi:hypothetical protein
MSRPSFAGLLPYCQLHRGNFLALIDDDFLRDTAQLLVAAVTQLRLGHLDRALVMRHHRRDKIIFDMAASFSARKEASSSFAADTHAAATVNAAASVMASSAVRERFG